MTTWTAPATAAPGGLTSAYLNTNVRDNELYLKEVLAGTNADKVPLAAIDKANWAWPHARAYMFASWVLLNNTVTTITFDSERYDNDAIHDLVTNKGRLTCKTQGLYLIFGHLVLPANATGKRQLRIQMQGSFDIGRVEQAGSASAAAALTVMTVRRMAVNDYVELLCYQDSGGSLTVGATAEYESEFGMAMVSGY